MPDDKKPRPPLPHRDYSGVGHKSPVRGVPVVIIEHEPTPPPRPGTISNEDLAVSIKAVRKEHEGYAADTTQRLSTIEDRQSGMEGALRDQSTKLGGVDLKVDTLLLRSLKREDEERTITVEKEKATVAIKTHEAIADVEVEKREEITKIEVAAHREKTSGEIQLERWKIFGRVVGLLAAGGGLVHLLENCR